MNLLSGYFLDFQKSHKNKGRAITTLEYVKLQKSKDGTEPLYALDLLLKHLNIETERIYSS